MSSHHSGKLKIAAAWLTILLAGLAVGWLGARRQRAEMVGRLLDEANRSAVAFEPGEVRALAGTRADRDTPGYAAVKQRLRKLQAIDPRVRFVTIFRFRPETGRVITLADSAVPGAKEKDESLPGDDYPQAAQSPGLQQIIRTGQPSTEGPLADDFGTWMTGYTLIGEAPSGKPGMTSKDILGLDLEASQWRRQLWQSAFQGAFYVWMLLGLPFIALIVTRRQGEQREVIRNFSEAMEQSHSAIMIVDLESRIEYANRSWCRQVGYSRRELLGRNWREFRVLQPSEDAFSDLIATVRSGRIWEGEWISLRKDGSTFPTRGIVTPVKHRDGSLACFIAVFDDVTETKRREAELREARDLALAGDRAKGQFLATMSHEVRTPLNGIVGFTSLLLETSLTSEQRDYVQTIRSGGEALIQLTGDILDFARIESGRLKLDLMACDPRECVEDAFDLLAAKAAERNIELIHRVADNVPAAVLTDGGRVRQVLVNLIGNAVKFTERGEVEVSISLGETKPQDRAQVAEAERLAGGRGDENQDGAGSTEVCTLIFAVRDTGIGISPDQHAKLFKPFSQLDDSSTRRYGGTGLGLAISHNLVRLLGGDITFVSELGRGSTFTFTVCAAVAAPLLPPRDLGGVRLGLAMRPGSLRRELAELLTGWRAQLTEADGPAELARESWDLGLVEVSEEVARELVAHPEPLPGLPPKQMVALVPVSLPNDLRATLHVHFRLLVNKPVHHGALFALVSGARLSAPPPAPPPPQFGFRVLVVEDNAVNRRLVQRVLQNIGCTATVVENGRQALQELSAPASEYDVVLLDLHMPEMDGLTALREIRRGHAGPRAQNIWVIALTADARDEQRERGFAAGLNDYLTKPLQLPELEAALRRFRQERGVRPR